MSSGACSFHCAVCRKNIKFAKCIYDRSYKCPTCAQILKLGNNAYRNYKQRLQFYYNALLSTGSSPKSSSSSTVDMDHRYDNDNDNSNVNVRQKSNVLALVLSADICQLLACFCADVPLFKTGDLVDFKPQTLWQQSRVIGVKFDDTAFEQIQIRIGSQSHSQQTQWLNVCEHYYDSQTLCSLNVFWPNSAEHAITVRCGKCALVLYDKLAANEYEIADPTQPHFSFELLTNTAPHPSTNVITVGLGKYNCKNNCHGQLWLIDNGSGSVLIANGFSYALACGRTYNRVEKYVDGQKREQFIEDCFSVRGN